MLPFHCLTVRADCGQQQETAFKINFDHVESFAIFVLRTYIRHCNRPDMKNIYLASKPRFEILDGLRGVAALTVVIFHLFETYSKGPDFQIINHGYLAVDFFFILSGFVIGYAYDDRWDRMSIGGFFKRRLVRLQPMVIVGSIVGMLLFYAGDNQVWPSIGQTEWWKVIVLCIIGMTLLPVPLGMDARGWGEMHPLNGPCWSLFWEYIANILYALVFRYLPKLFLAVFVALAAVLTADLCLNIDIFGLLEARTETANTVIGGWSLTPTQLYVGASRLLYPFFCGLLLSRLNARISIKGGFWICAVLVLAVLAMPFIPGGEKGTWTSANGIYNLAIILFVFPLIVSIGAGSRIEGKKGNAVCRFLGDISYPLYITHYPLVYAQTAWASAHKDAPLGEHIFVAVSVTVLAIALAYACLKLYDEPVREWLKKKVLMTKSAE